MANEEKITLVLSIEIPKQQLLSAIEKDIPLTLNVSIGSVQLESEKFFHENKEKILFLMQSVKNIDISTQNRNILETGRIEYVFELAEKWPQVIKFQGFGGKSISNLLQLFQSVGLDLWNPKILLIAAAKEKLKK